MDCSEFTILLVDDEAAVLSSLKRLMRPLKCTLYTAESAALGIEVLEQHPIDLVISDMRMPETSGDQFLADVAERWPATERVVMTGYADTQAAIDAINNGRISRFMSKPWDDADVINVVQKSFELTNLRRMNERLVRDNADKQARLEQLNQSLEKTIEQRTLQLQKNHEQLINSYRSTVRMFSALIARRLGQNAEQGVSLNKLFLAVVNQAQIDRKDLKQLYYAWQLRNLGKLSFDDELLKPAYTDMTPIQQRRFHQHPLLAHASISLVRPLYGAGEIIRQHKEYLDGSGYPNGLSEDDITPAAQLLCVVNDFVELTNGRYQAQAMSTAAALDYMRGYAHERYNAEDVERLNVALETLSQEGEALHDRVIRSSDMAVGMTLSRDLLSAQGVLLLSAGQVLDDLTIQRVIDMEINLAEILKIYIDQ
ncbi:HD domain-containing phosphohydrolase [Amphritea sp.]|uniref:HD domain-containing phosphohydrolase n=1 Tax=Amphritea sp. TaxID=1872502 RepID=UPI003A93F246